MTLLTVPDAPTQATMLYEQLKYRLMTGGVLPGQKLSIRKLSVEMATGIMPVREALKRLASERVLSSLVKRSYEVPLLNKKRAADLFNLRALLESEAAVQALAQISEAEVKDLRALIPRMHRAVLERRWDLYMVENHRFHFSIYHLCDNFDMIALVEQLWMQTGPSLRLGLEDSQPEPTWTDVHEALVDAISKRDGTALRIHLLTDIRWDWSKRIVS